MVSLRWRWFLMATLAVVVLASATTGQDKKAEPPRLTRENLEQFLTNALEEPKASGTTGDSRYLFILDKKINIGGTDWTFRVEVFFMQDPNRLWLFCKLADLPNPATLPPRELFALLKANNDDPSGHYFGCSDFNLWMNKPLDTRALTPREFNRQITDFVNTLAKTFDLWQVARWPAPAGQRAVLKGHTNWVRGAAVSADGRRALSGGDDKLVLLWDAVGGQELARLEGHTDYVFGVALSPDGKKGLSAGRDGTVRLWDLEAKKELRQFAGHKHLAWCVAFAPDGRTAASGGGFFTGKNGKPADRDDKPTDDPDTTIRLWDVDTGKELKRLDGHTKLVRSVAFSADGRRLVSACEDGTVRLWDVEAGKQLRQWSTGGPANGAVFTPDGKGVVAACADRTVRLWDADGGPERRRYEGHTSSVWCVAVSADGKRIVSSGHDRGTRVWDLASGKALALLGGHTDAVTSVAFTPDGRQAVTAGYDMTVRVWDLPR